MSVRYEYLVLLKGNEMTETVKKVFQVWWANAGCLPDSENPAYEADTLADCQLWLTSDEAREYFDTVGEWNTYDFVVLEAESEV